MSLWLTSLLRILLTLSNIQQLTENVNAVTEIICVESSLTNRYQTTVPDAVRKILGLSKRDKICYTIQSDGEVVISRAEQTQSDPVLGQFLNFLARDIVGLS
ncbi:type II toxin-antitoxin system PrlF family antitoxin [Scytonema hofmannii]|uniref:type II toxin-antitoxin system PrlF family antitoxin n=1 Tax=Scytonema hofmannii TaxID=34078 RepID=UPI003010463F